MQRKKCICFDFDDTLVKSLGLTKESLIRTLNYFGHNEITMENLHDYFGPTEPGIITNILGEDEALAALPYFYQTYSELQSELLVKNDEITEMLESLSKRPDLLILLITGRSQETLDISSHFLDYEKYFKKTYVGSMDGINKDESMKEAMHDFDLEKEDMLYIGDTLEDISVMKENDYDIFSAGYFHDEEYQKKLTSENENTFTSIKDLYDAILKVI